MIHLSARTLRFLALPLLCAGLTLAGVGAVHAAATCAGPVVAAVAEQGVWSGNLGGGHTLMADAPASIHEYYDQGGARLWSDRRGKRRLRELVEAVESLADVGLDPSDYGAVELRAALRGRRDDGVEAAASLVYAALAADLERGRVRPLSTYEEGSAAEHSTGAAKILRILSESESVAATLRDLRTGNPVQTSLVSLLLRYQKYADDNAWTAISLSSDILMQGAAGADVLAVEKRLAAEGFYELPQRTESSISFFGPALRDAVAAFQISRGIVADGIIGPQTLRRLNETPEGLVRSIRLNIERARWLPQQFPHRLLMVNIAGFTVGAWENDVEQFTIRTVVGDTAHKTPVFIDEMEYVVANPYWNVPTKIVVEEIAPKQAADPGYLARNGMEVVAGWSDDAPVVSPQSINWRAVTGSESWRLRQRSGPSNALGHIKFMFPNQYAVYLHDSPDRALFDRSERAFSHGCIRVAEPYKLAGWVLKGTEWQGRERQLIDSGVRRQVFLPAPIPVFVSYFTVWPDQGGPRFYNDIYERDAHLASAIDRHSARIRSTLAAALD